MSPILKPSSRKKLSRAVDHSKWGASKYPQSQFAYSSNNLSLNDDVPSRQHISSDCRHRKVPRHIHSRHNYYESYRPSYYSRCRRRRSPSPAHSDRPLYHFSPSYSCSYSGCQDSGSSHSDSARSSSRSRNERSKSSASDSGTTSLLSCTHESIRSATCTPPPPFGSTTGTQGSPYLASDESLSVTGSSSDARYEKDIKFHAPRYHEVLPLEFWERTPECKEAKCAHMDRLDELWDSRESLVLLTTLSSHDTVLEPNMFPYDTPSGVKHYTLWSIKSMSHQQILAFVDEWLLLHMPWVRRWEYDDNGGECSVRLFHVHVFIETRPYSFTPDPDKLYLPEHAQKLAEGQTLL